MKYEVVDIKNEASVKTAALYLYLLDDSPKFTFHDRPMVIICPGGGYEFLSDREGEPVAMQYLAMGYHAAVLHYSVAPAVYPTALLELCRSVAVIRENAKKWHVDPEKIVVSGFSAGGHLAACCGTFWNREFLSDSLGIEGKQFRPDAMILCYPVITSGEYAHKQSFRNLLGDAYEEKKEELSLEKFVGEQVPRTFIWHTAEDSSVPVQNSLFMAEALTEHQVPVELHVFEKGKHGLSLANRLTASGEEGSKIEDTVAVWPELVHHWMEGWGK